MNSFNIKTIVILILFFGNLCFSQADNFNFKLLENNDTTLTFDQFNLLNFYFGEISYSEYSELNAQGIRFKKNDYLSNLNGALEKKELNHLKTIYDENIQRKIIDYEYYRNSSIPYVFSLANDYLEVFEGIKKLQNSLSYTVSEILSLDYDNKQYISINSDNVISIRAKLVNKGTRDIKSVTGEIHIKNKSHNNTVLKLNLNSDDIPPSTKSLEKMSYREFYNRQVNENQWVSLPLFVNWKYLSSPDLANIVRKANFDEYYLEFVAQRITLTNGQVLE